MKGTSPAGSSLYTHSHTSHPDGAVKNPVVGFNPFPVLVLTVEIRVLCASLTPPVTYGDGSRATAAQVRIRIGRKYSLLDRPLDAVPDCYTDFGL